MATVKLYSTIRLAAGEKVLESEARTVGELLDPGELPGVWEPCRS